MVSKFRVPGSALIIASAGLAVVMGGWCRGALIEDLPFDGNANAAVGTNGTLNSANGNQPTFVADQNGNANSAVSFDGSTTDKQNVQVSSGGGLAGRSTGTIVMEVRWVGAQPGGFSYGTVLSRQDNGQYSNDVITLSGSDPSTAKIQFRLTDCCNNSVTSVTSPGDGVWHQLAVTFDGTTKAVQLYLDGALDSTGAYTGGVNGDTTTPLAIGAWLGDGNTYSSSNVSDFRVYDSVLTQAEIQALVPEPASLALLTVAGAGLLIRRRPAAR